MSSDVFFANARTWYGSNLNDKLKILFDRSGIADLISEQDSVAIKIHWGEKGNLTYSPPPLIRTLVELVRDAGGHPFITDTNTLYKGSRGNAIDNLRTAYENGFTYGTIGAPVIIADGLRGDDYVKVKVDGKHFKKVKIASGIHNANVLIVFSHFKGHEATGFGGTIKNISMGCAAPSGKQNMHSDVKPKVKAKKCRGCGSCVEKCPVAAITMTADDKASINKNICIGCAECTVVCRYGAVAISWKSDLNIMMEKMTEYALGTLSGKKGKCAFFNLITSVTPDCDCCGWSDVPIVPDIGLLVSRDPVASDQAAVDLVNRAPGISASRLGSKADSDDKFGALFDVDWRHQLERGERIGLGSRDYNLIDVEKELDDGKE